MPELPEVETTLRGIETYVSGRSVKQVVVRNFSLRWPVPRNINAVLAGQKVHKLWRRAKYLLWQCESGHMLLHLGMSGSLRVVPVGSPAGKHDHVDIEMDNGQAIRLTDPRRFGALLWLEGDPEQHTLLAQLGPEPLTGAFDGERLYRMSRNRKVPVKTFIMDNKTVVGVGNIYANEALFESGIDPRRAAGRISRERYLRLADTIKEVLARAIAQGGTTLKDFVGGDGKPGYFAQELKVYGRSEQPCVHCSKPLQEIRMGQRTTVFCSHCQT
ncbi:bifunctional DNA-formamidopyrimidine glycosylase/DNA-(apurinic or apyrimidinic site) lyase [Porticoccaceae bacterium LTM1]|nr:bifunctional DNA-formamidopyrimidine glycosylase/DNA-(apurinic or apyrimidinic site) lyase [Porticoccaceae bacterium LTM1]